MHKTSRAQDVLVSLFIIFVGFPAALLILMLFGRLPLSTIAAIETLYYIAIIVVITVKGLEWLEDQIA